MGSVPVVSSSGITGYHDQYIDDGEGVITGRYGTLGEIHYVNGKYWPLNTTLYVTDFKNNFPKFIYYFLKTIDFEGANSAGAVPGINRNNLKNIVVRVPCTSTQKKIASILSNYDDLIQTNQQRITLLEEAAQRLYDEWFVKLRFPNHEQVPVVDGVPEGWTFKALEQIAHIEMGQSPESKYYNSQAEGLPFHQGVTEFNHRFVTNSVYTSSYTRSAMAGDILCSVRAPVGRLNITLEDIAIGRGLSAFRSKENLQSLLFYQLQTIFRVEDSIGSGSIFNSVTKKELVSQQVLFPSNELAYLFNSIAQSLDEQVKNLSIQNQKLMQARDELLPRLMSGRLDVSTLSTDREE
jgi:type I restriction enzyme S subunit